MNKYLLLLLLVISAPTHAQWWNPFAPKTYQECVLTNMKGVTSDAAATAIMAACAAKDYPSAAPSTKSKCLERTLHDWEVANVQMSADITNLGTPYFLASVYNGNRQLSVSAITVIISAPNFRAAQEYSLCLQSPIVASSSGKAGISIAIVPSAGWGYSIKEVRGCEISK